MLELTQYLKTLKQPTVLVVFGDHLPNLQGVYDAYHFFKDDPERTNLKNYQTPFAVWSNFKLNKKEFKQPYVAASFVAPKLLQMSGVPLSNYYQLIQQVSNCYSAIHQKFVIEADECLVDKKALLEQYKNLNHDVLDGNNHTYEMFRK